MRCRMLVAFLLAASVLGGSKPASARKTRVVGRIKLPKSKLECGEIEKAYWAFEVPDLPHPPCRAGMHGYLVTLDHWDAKRAKKLSGGRTNPSIKLHGVQLEPRMLVVPKESQSYDVTITNTDRFGHEIYSPGNDKLGTETINPSTSRTVRFDSLPAVERGAVAYYPLRDKSFSHVEGGVAFVRSTAYSKVDRSGRFLIKRVPSGTYALRVWHRGKKIHQQEIKVRRRPVRMTIDLRPEKQKKAEGEPARKKEADEKADESEKPRRKRRRRRRRRRRKRRRRRRNR